MRVVSWRASVGLAFVAGVAGAACGDGDVFNCRNDAQCAARNGSGVCEASGVCSFPDATCPSGKRYADHAGELSTWCVPANGEVPPEWEGASEDVGEGSTGSVGTTGMPEPDPPAETGPAGECVWWDSAWAFRTMLQPTGDLGESLSGVPVLVQLDASRFDYGSARPDGADLRFVRAADEQELAFEIERWDPAGTSVVWVRFDSLTDADEIWMYYGNPAAAQPFSPPQVWSEPYALVTHMDGPLQDVCGLNSVSDHQSDAAVGRMGDAREFAGDQDYVSAGNDAAIADVFATGGTVTAWIFAEEWGGGNWGRVLDKSSGFNAGQGWALLLTDGFGGTLEFRRDAGPIVIWRAPDAAITLGQWHWLALTLDETDIEAGPTVYIDGEPVELQRDANPNDNGIESDAEHPLWIGNRNETGDRQFDGRIDEVRMATVVRSAAWMQTQYRSMTDTLLQFEPPEARPAECEQAE